VANKKQNIYLGPRLALPASWQHNPAMAHQFTTSHISDSITLFRYYKRLAERAMELCSEEALFATLDNESNSVAIVIKHMAGNMRSRWTDFLTSDGEKPDRHRDSEFEDAPKTRAELIDIWEGGWKCLFEALEALSDEDANRTVLIRTEPHSVMQAINRQIAHYSYHVGQITFLCKHFCAEAGNWNSLTIPRKMSADFNARVSSRLASQR
jgi:Protein of unknown function (DUF1572)